MSNTIKSQFQSRSKVLVLKNTKEKLRIPEKEKNKILKVIIHISLGSLFFSSLITLSILNNKMFMDRILISSFIISCLFLLKTTNQQADTSFRKQ